MWMEEIRDAFAVVFLTDRRDDETGECGKLFGNGKFANRGRAVEEHQSHRVHCGGN